MVDGIDVKNQYLCHMQGLCKMFVRLERYQSWVIDKIGVLINNSRNCVKFYILSSIVFLKA